MNLKDKFVYGFEGIKRLAWLIVKENKLLKNLPDRDKLALGRHKIYTIHLYWGRNFSFTATIEYSFLNIAIPCSLGLQAGH